LREISPSVKKTEAQLQQWNEALETRVQERTHALVRSEEGLRTVTSQLRVTDQRERRRLATILHDSLAPSLALIRIKLHQTKQQVKSDEALTSSVQELDELVLQCLTVTRTIMAQLRPSILHDCGLVPALRWLADQMTAQGLEVAIKTPEGGTWPRLGEEREAILFDAVRELLFNVRKHAGVPRATVYVEQQGTAALQITVSDDGVGFDLVLMQGSTSAEHFGLSGMHERMETIAQRCVIGSIPGAGTRVRLEMPLLDIPVSSGESVMSVDASF
jgi:signal transduction histidine kinase